MKKLTLALVAILLALTCVFAACGKKDNTPDKPADNTDTTPAPAETVKKDDLTKIAEQFKADYVANFLDLYTSETVAVIESEKSATLIKIQAATTAAEAQKAADDFFTFLKGQKTIIDAAKDLLTKIADVALADEGAINQLKIYKDQITAAQASATSTAKKAALEAYDAATQKSVDETIARLADLKDAKREADKKDAINDEIKDLKKDFDAVVKFTLSEVNQYTDLMKKVNAFAAKYDIVVGSDAYKEIFDVASIAAAEAVMNKAYADSDALGLMQKVLEQRDAVVKAAEDARWKGQVVYVDAKLLKSVNADIDEDGKADDDFVAPVALTPAAVAAKGASKGYNAVVVLDGAFMYAKNTDLYSTEAAAKQARVANITEVELRTSVTTKDSVAITIGTDYKLAVQDAVQAAKKAVTNLFTKYNVDALKSDFNYGATGDVLAAAVSEINAIAAAYDTSIAAAKAYYKAPANLFATANEFTTGGKAGSKTLTYATYTLGVTLKSKAADNQNIIFDKITEVLPTFRGLDADGNETFDAKQYFVDAGEYAAKDADSAAILNYTLNDKDQPAITYKAWGYHYELDGEPVALKDFSAIEQLAWANYPTTPKTAATNTAKAALAADTIEWIEKYIGEGDYEASYNLYLFKDSKGDNVFAKDDILYMADRDLTEVADALVTKIGGKAVEVAKTDAVAAKVLSVYNVAKALVAEQEKIDAAQAEAMEKLQAAALALREAGDANAVADLRTAFDAVANGNAISKALYEDVKYAPYTKVTSDSSTMSAKLAALKVTVQEETLNAAEVKKAIDDGATGILRDAEAIRDAAKALAFYVDPIYAAVKTASGKLKANADAQAENAEYLKFYNEEIVAAAVKKAEIAAKGDSLKLIGDEATGAKTYDAKDAAGNLSKKAAAALLENVYTLRMLFTNEGVGESNGFEAAYKLAIDTDATNSTSYYNFLGKTFTVDLDLDTTPDAFTDVAFGTYKTFLNLLSTEEGVSDVTVPAYFDGTGTTTITGLDKYLANIDDDTATGIKDLKELKAEVNTLKDTLNDAVEAYKGIKAVKASTVYGDKTALGTLATAVSNFAKTYKCDYVNIKISETIVDGTVYDFDLLTEAYREQILVKAYEPIDKVLIYAKGLESTYGTYRYVLESLADTEGSTWKSAAEGKVEFRGAAVPAVASIKTGDALVSDYEAFESDYSFANAADLLKTAAKVADAYDNAWTAACVAAAQAEYTAEGAGTYTPTGATNAAIRADAATKAAAVDTDSSYTAPAALGSTPGAASTDEATVKTAAGF